jgi:hypothetical protein
MGVTRFGKSGSTYNDNGSAEKSGKIDHLVNALQTYGMSFRDTPDMFRTQNGDYALEDSEGALVATVPNTREWRRKNRRMYARVKNAKAKPEERIDPFDAEELSKRLESKRGNMRTVSAAFREVSAASGGVLSSPEYKPLVEAETAARKALEKKAERASLTAAMSEEDFSAAVAVANRLVKEQGERVRRQAVYSTPYKRYQAVLDIMIRGGELSAAGRLFKAGYESRMGKEEKIRRDVYIHHNEGAVHGYL